MKTILIAASLALSAFATAAHGAEITDDTPARGITVGHYDGEPVIIVSNEIASMKVCRESIKANLDAMASAENEGLVVFCVPADMTAPGSYKNLPAGEVKAN